MKNLKAFSFGEGWVRLSTVDEYKPAGRYEVVFNASIYPSGVYFYKLQAGDYVAVKECYWLNSIKSP